MNAWISGEGANQGQCRITWWRVTDPACSLQTAPLHHCRRLQLTQILPSSERRDVCSWEESKMILVGLERTLFGILISCRHRALQLSQISAASKLAGAGNWIIYRSLTEDREDCSCYEEAAPKISFSAILTFEMTSFRVVITSSNPLTSPPAGYPEVSQVANIRPGDGSLVAPARGSLTCSVKLSHSSIWRESMILRSNCSVESAALHHCSRDCRAGWGWYGEWGETHPADLSAVCRDQVKSNLYIFRSWGINPLNIKQDPTFISIGSSQF